jgi:hypothetical protein
MDIHAALISLLQAMLRYKAQAGKLEQLPHTEDGEAAEQTAQLPRNCAVIDG